MVEIIVSNLFNPKHPRKVSYVKGKQIIVNVMKTVLCQGRVLIIT